MFHQVLTKYVCGIDLHAKKMSVCVMDLSGKVLMTKGSIPCTTNDLLEVLDPWLPDITIGIESTYNWYWLVDSLTQHKITNVLGHALYIKRKMHMKHKTDSVDARGLADLLRTNQFPVAYSYPREMRSVRDLLRRRQFFVRQRAGTYTHFQMTLHQDGYIKPLRNKLVSKAIRQSLLDCTKDEDIQAILSSDLEYISGLDTIIRQIEKRAVQKARFHNHKHFNALLTIPGCGEVLALTVLYEMHTIDRFRSPQKFSSYCRVVRAENSSAGKNLGRSTNDKIGNAHLKWAISELGQCMINNYPDAKRWHDELSQKIGKCKAHSHLRHKIAVVIYHMLKDDRVFNADKFLGISGRAENPAHKGTETTRQYSEPMSENENLLDPANSKREDVKERRTRQTTGKRKVLTNSVACAR